MNNQMTEQERQFYFVQHKFLPHLFYSGSKPFVKRILTLGGDSFVDLLCAMNDDDDESDEEYMHIPFASCHLHGKILPLCR